MDNVPFRKAEKGLTREAFNQFLRRLYSDQEFTGKEYQTLYCALIIFFEQHGRLPPENFAAETLKRVARVLHEGEKIDNLNSYTLAEARKLLRENWHSPQPEATKIRKLLFSQTMSQSMEEPKQQHDLIQNKEG